MQNEQKMHFYCVHHMDFVAIELLLPKRLSVGMFRERKNIF